MVIDEKALHLDAYGGMIHRPAGINFSLGEEVRRYRFYSLHGMGDFRNLFFLFCRFVFTDEINIAVVAEGGIVKNINFLVQDSLVNGEFDLFIRVDGCV